MTLLAAAWSTSLADLDPAFAAEVDDLITTLEAAGFHPVASCTYRSPEVQDLLFRVGTATQAKGGESCHNQRLAVDLWDGGLSLGLITGDAATMQAQTPFLRALGAAAHAAGLRWGGDWHGHTSAWDSWDLGWDPAHVEARRCR